MQRDCFIFLNSNRKIVMKVVIAILFFLLTYGVLAQDNYYPSNAEIGDLDSVVFSRFKESLCYDSTIKYKVHHIFQFEFNTDSLFKQDFLNGSIMSKVRKKYMSKELLIPPFLPKYQQNLALWAEEQSNPERTRDSLMDNGDLVNLKKFEGSCTEDLGIVQSESSYISDSKGKLIAFWYPLDYWPGCQKQCEDNNLLNKDLFEILNEGNYKLIFHIHMTSGGNYLAIDMDGNMSFISTSIGGNYGVKITTIEELVNTYWEKFDVFNLFDR